MGGSCVVVAAGGSGTSTAEATATVVWLHGLGDTGEARPLTAQEQHVASPAEEQH